jgi:cbb3-type cytochrome oxidase subunit 3
MDWSAWANFGYGAALVVIFLGIIIYYFSRNRKKTVEEPKYRMLEDDE